MTDRLNFNFWKAPGTRSPNTFRMFNISIMAAAIGITAGLVAYALFTLIGLLWNLIFFQQMSTELTDLEQNPIGLWMLIVPAIGGIVVSLMAKYGTPKIKGHGIPEAMEAVLENRSRISPRVAIFKPIATAIAIGTGGPFGAEGPIIQTGGALGSILGQIVHTTAAERKVLLACGAAAGMAATFNTPIAAVILAIELLLFEFKSRSFIPLVIATVVATTVRMPLLGQGPLFQVVISDFGIPRALPFYILLGLLCGLAALSFTRALYWIEDLFEQLPVSEFWLPVIGGLGLGIIGYFVPRVLGVGYDTISGILNNQLPLNMLLTVMIFKSLALLISLGSGTSGGLLAPMFMASAAMGGVLAILLNSAIPGLNLEPGAFALAAMAAVFGAASRSTFAFIIFAFEITQDYHAILPLMLVCVIADGVALFLMQDTIMTEKLARRGLRVPQEYEADILRQVSVGAVMDSAPMTLPNTLTVQQLANYIAQGEPAYIRHQAFPIVDENGRLSGIITRSDLLRALEATPGETLSVCQAGTQTLVVTYPDELLHDALHKLLAHDIGRLPVVKREAPQTLAGYLSRGAILRARQGKLDEEQVREPGWITQLHS
ncbi:MAG: chloride channel protein [Ardenticatenaceae bacterium]|nr:chloride channel protein [Ardenticatenaceae bacterium]